jgi:predicted RND superfamily exporter protein
MASKYPQWSPYVFVFNSPLIHIDTDGREGIVVSGSPGDHKNREHFLVNGLYKAKEAQKHFQRKGETVTWIVYNDKKNGYTQKQLETYKAKAEKVGVTMMVVSDVDDIVDYVNNKSGGDIRKNDPITSFYYVGHSTPGDLDVGYRGTGENFEPDDFDSDAFSSGTYVNLVGGCRTTVPGWFEDSNVTQFQEILDEKSNIYGSDVRVYYSGGVVTDENLVKKNKGNIVKRKGELPVKK